MDEVRAEAKSDYDAELAKFNSTIGKSEDDFDERMVQYEKDVVIAHENYDKEMADFKALTLLERLALTEQGKKPVLRLPNKPQYVEPKNTCFY